MANHCVEFKRGPANVGHAGKLEILLYDVIGEDFFGGISAKEFREQIMAAGDVSEIDVRINSPGGQVFDSFAMFNTLAVHPATVTTFNDGLAASGASIVMMAGVRRVASAASSMMIHNAHGVEFGGHEAMSLMASRLETMDGQLADIYTEAIDGDRAQVMKWLDAETWWTGDEALEAGFVTEIEAAPAMAASLDRSWFKNVPARIATQAAQATAQEASRRDRSWQSSRAKLRLADAQEGVE